MAGCTAGTECMLPGLHTKEMKKKNKGRLTQQQAQVATLILRADDK
jgi:hypothetical protein